MKKFALAVLLVSAMAQAAFAAPGGADPSGATGAATMNHDIRPGAGVTSVGWLSAYLPSLAGTPGDTKVYYLDSGVPGGTVFVSGGTHTNEIAGIAAAVLFIERAKPEKGRLIVIPYANNSASSWTDKAFNDEAWFPIETKNGTRWLKSGARLTYLGHQGEPDPKVYKHPNSDEVLDGFEARNLDRAYPGKADGNLTQRVAYAILSLIKKEGADVALDMHEAGAGSRLEWMMVANPKNIDQAAAAVLGVEMQGVEMKLEPSSENFRGLSHREWGDACKVQSYLVETPNPAMAADAKKDADRLNDPKDPLWKRVGTHIQCLLEIIAAYDDSAAPERVATVGNLPSLADIQSQGLGAFYN
jgi:hypothetical protein